MAEFYNVNVLDAALREVGIPIDGCASDGRIDFRAEATAVQKEQGAQILADYDPDVALWGEVRKERNQLLRDSDWIAVTDSVLSAEEQADWGDYRQELRDIPQTFSDDPESVVWPEIPEE